MIAALLVASAVTFPATSKTVVVVEVGAGDVRVTGETRRDIAVDARGAAAIADGDRIVVRAEDAGGVPNREAPCVIVIRVPRATVFESIAVVDGDVELEGVTGSVRAEVKQGRIRAARVSGALRLETGFGDVDVERATLTAGGLLRLRAFNGDVRLSLASYPVNARVLAVTFNGTIESNLPLARRESFGPRFAEATFGTGEPLISVDSITGKITITAAGSPPK